MSEENEEVAWVCDDGELTELRAVMEHWKHFGYRFTGLTEVQYCKVKIVLAAAVRALTKA